MPVDTTGRPRHPGQEEEPLTLSVWKCPACGVENTSLLAQGCPACGSGRPGQHVVAQEAQPVIVSPTDAMFTAWMRHRHPDVEGWVETLMREAWHAGAEAARLETAPTDVLLGTAESRTLVAALRLFSDQVLRYNPEEVRSGEWLSAAEVEQVVARLEGGTHG